MDLNVLDNNAILDYGLSVDKIITSFIKPAITPQSGIPNGIDPTRFRAGRIHMLYDAAYNLFNKPLCMTAAQQLLKCEPESNVLILTGFLHPVYYPKGETDGPPGAVGLARALSMGLNLKPIIFSEEIIHDVISDACIAGGLSTIWDKSYGYRSQSCSLQGFELMDIDDTKSAINEVLDELNPSAIISVERTGRNNKNEYHSVLGTSVTPYAAKLDYFMDEAKRRNILTIGIGDNGNEIGFGNIFSDVQKIQMFGETCQCPCKSGIATVVESDILVPGATSNWGAYGIESCISLLLGDPKIMHDGGMEHRVLLACSSLGCADGSTTHTTPTCDGTGNLSVYLCDILKNLVEQSVYKVKRGF